MLVALGTVLMVVGGYVEVLDLTVCALVSLLVAFACVEIGSPYTWLIWLATSLATFLIPTGKSLWLLYLLSQHNLCSQLNKVDLQNLADKWEAS